MRILLALTVALGLAGCAQFEAMTTEQKWTVAAIVVGTAIVAYHAADDDNDVTVIGIQPHGHEHEGHCFPPGQCRD